MQPDDLEAIADVVAQTIQEALAPLLITISEVRAQLAVHEADLATAKAAVAPVAELVTTHAVLGAKLAALETRPDGPRPAELELLKSLADVRERVAVVETRAPVPGPAGKDGTHGTDGAPGQDGAAGKDGTHGTDGTAGLSFEGVYQEGQPYAKGALVTWAGSSWHCNEPTTTKPGDGSKDWTLMVKRGRDGRDGKDAATVPVVKVG